MREGDGETADVSNPHPAEASAGATRSGQPLPWQLQHLRQSQVGLKTENIRTQPNGEVDSEVAQGFGEDEDR